MGKECEQVHIIALTEYLGIGVSIEYLDGRCVCLLFMGIHFICTLSRHRLDNDDMYHTIIMDVYAGLLMRPQD